jgi:cytidyltransferase-like protein
MRSYVLMTALPPTLGHLDLIRFAATLGGEVVVIVTTQPDEPYRTTIEGGIRYAPCDDTKRGHFYPTHSDSDEFGMPLDRCWGCGTPAPAVPSTTEQENS